MSRIFAVLVCLAAVLGAAAVFWHYFVPAYAMPGWVPVVAVTSAALTVLAATWAVRSRHTDVMPFALVSALFLVGLAAMFTIGIGLLVIAVILVVLFVRMGRAGRITRPTGRSATAAAAVGLLFPVTTLLALQGPLVKCHSNGMSGGETLWLRASSGTYSSGSGRSMASTSPMSTAGPQTPAGEMWIGYQGFGYSCLGDELREFRRLSSTDRP